MFVEDYIEESNEIDGLTIILDGAIDLKIPILSSISATSIICSEILAFLAKMKVLGGLAWDLALVEKSL